MLEHVTEVFWQLFFTNIHQKEEDKIRNQLLYPQILSNLKVWWFGWSVKVFVNKKNMNKINFELK